MHALLMLKLVPANAKDTPLDGGHSGEESLMRMRRCACEPAGALCALALSISPHSLLLLDRRISMLSCALYTTGIPRSQRALWRSQVRLVLNKLWPPRGLGHRSHLAQSLESPWRQGQCCNCIITSHFIPGCSSCRLGIYMRLR